MSRKPPRGYFVKGQFVAEGSALDADLKRQLKYGRDTSKTERKRESEALQDLGRELLELRADLLLPLHLPDALQDALQEARRITDFEGKRRHMQFIGKLMRKLDDADVQAIRHALQQQKDGSHAAQALLHTAEHWRDRLLDAHTGDAALTDWCHQHPDTDMQQLRALIRQARKDAHTTHLQPPESHGQAQRHSRAYRDIFLHIKTALQ